MEIDFRTLKRKDLQRLCKKHGLRANSTNSQMADSLASLFKNCEENKQVNVHLRGSGKNNGKGGESAERNTEKVLIILDEEDDEHDPILRKDNKYSSKDWRSNEKNEQTQASLEQSDVNGDSKVVTVQRYEENSVIFLDEKNYELDPVLRGENKKNCRSKRVRKVSEPELTNMKNIPIDRFEELNEDLIVPIELASSSSMNTKIAQVVYKLKRKRRGEEVVRQNAELPLDTSKSENTTISNETSMLDYGDAHSKRKQNNRNFALKVNDEAVDSLRDEVPVTDILVCDETFEKHSSVTTKSDYLTSLIDENQTRQGIETRNEQEIEELEPSIANSLIPLDFGTLVAGRPNKRTRGDLEAGIPVLEEENAVLDSTQQPEFVLTKELELPEVDFSSSQIYVNGSPSIFASSNFPLLSSELQGGQDGVDSESLRKHRTAELELEESLDCKNSIVFGITMMEVEDTSGRTRSTSKSDYVLKDEEASKQPSPISLSYSLDDCNSQGRCSISINLVRNLEDGSQTCFIADDQHKGCCSETPVSMNGFYSYSEKGCEALKSSGSKVKGVDVRLRCLDSNKVGRGEREGISELFKKHQHHKDKLNLDECQEGCADKKSGNCCFKEDSPIISQEDSMVKEDIFATSPPPSERSKEMNNMVVLLESTGRHDQNIYCLVKKTLQKAGGESFVNNFVGREALKKCSSAELDDEQTWQFLGESYNESIIVKSKNFQRFSSSQRLAEINYGQSSESYESATLLEELSETKGERLFKKEDNVQVIQEKLKHDGEKLCGSEEPLQAVGHNENSEPNNIAGNPTKKMKEIAPFRLSRRVDNLMEKLLCLRKVLRGEITSTTPGSSLLDEEEISYEECHPPWKEELISEQEGQAMKALMLTDFVHKDCELNSINSEVNFPNKIDETSTASSPHKLQENLEQWNGMESNSWVNYTVDLDFYVRPIGGEPCQDCHVDVRELSDIAKGAAEIPEELLEKIKFVSPSKKVSIIGLESEANSNASCSSKKAKAKKVITNTPAKDNAHVGTRCLLEISHDQSSLPVKQSFAKHIVDKLKMEAYEDVDFASPRDGLHGNLELDCMERFKASNCAAEGASAASYECDFSHNCVAEEEPYQCDVNVMGLFSIPQCDTPKTGQDLKSINFHLPSKHSVDLEGEKNASSGCTSKKTKLNNSTPKDISCFKTQSLSETLDGHYSPPTEQEYAKSSFHMLEVKSENNSVSRTGIFANANPSELRDPVEEISRKLSEFNISSSRKAIKSSSNNTPRKSTGNFKRHSSVCIRNKENTQSTKKNYPSFKRLMKNSASVGSIIRQPLRSVTNKMLD